MDNKENNAILAKTSFWYTIGNFLSRTIVFIATPIYIRFLTKEEYGLYSNFAAWMSMLSVITCMNLHSAIHKGRYEHRGNFNGFLKSVYLLIFFIISILLFITLIFYDKVRDLFSLSNLEILILFIYLYTYAGFSMYTGKYRAYFEIGKYILATSTQIVLTVVLSLVLMLIFPEHRLEALIIGQVIPSSIIGSIFIFLIFKSKGKVKKAYLVENARLGIPMIPHLIGVTALNKLDRVMITNLVGPEENAYYSVAGNVNAIIAVVSNSLNSAFIPWLTKALEEKKRDIKAIRKNSIVTLLIFSYCILVVTILAPEVIYIFGGKGYLISLKALVPLLIGAFFQYIYTMYVNLEFYSVRTVETAVATGIAAIINTVLNYIFIPKYGFVAAAMTTSFSYFVLFIIHYVIVKKIGLDYVYDIRKIIYIIFAIIFLSIFIGILYNFTIIRYLVILIVAIISFIFIYKIRYIWIPFFKRGKN